MHGAVVPNEFEKSVVGAESTVGEFHVWLGLVFNKDGFFHKTGFTGPWSGCSSLRLCIRQYLSHGAPLAGANCPPPTYCHSSET